MRVDLGTDGFGRVRVDFGDGRVTEWTGIVTSLELSHEYAAGGEYRLGAWLQLPEGQRGDRRTITVPGE